MVASRAHLLAGLRTGGPRASSPFEGDDSTSSMIDHQRYSSGSPPSSGPTLKASAAPFTPGSRASSGNVHAVDPMQEMEGQFAALRMQQIMAQNGQPQLAALYGATSGQPQSPDYHTQLQASEMDQLIRQKQAQLMQNQLLQQQQQQQQTRQVQIDALRMQAASHQQQQQAAAQQQQQQLLLAQMQAEYEAQQQQEQFHQQIYSAHEQRQAAQASIQASLRQRQVQQMYAQLLQQQQQEEASVEIRQQEAMLQRLHYLRQLQQGAVPMQQQQYGDFSFNESPPQTSARLPVRSASPAQAQLERRQRQASNTAADSAVSWRSSSASLGKHASLQSRTPPAIVVDDSASEKSEPGTASSTASEVIESPETSEEDVGSMLAKVAGIAKAASTTTTKKEPAPLPLAAPRAISLAAPRPRTFSSGIDLKTPNSSGASTPLPAASRQPRGPPTEFHAVNFASRLSVRTRRDAMSKLCASPRAASFSMNAVRSSIVA